MKAFEGAKWIWAEGTKGPNEAAVFCRKFSYEGGRADLSVTADSRYFLYVNGERSGLGRCALGHGGGTMTITTSLRG